VGQGTPQRGSSRARRRNAVGPPFVNFFITPKSLLLCRMITRFSQQHICCSLVTPTRRSCWWTLSAAPWSSRAACPARCAAARVVGARLPQLCVVACVCACVARVYACVCVCVSRAGVDGHCWCSGSSGAGCYFLQPCLPRTWTFLEATHRPALSRQLSGNLQTPDRPTHPPPFQTSSINTARQHPGDCPRQDRRQELLI
jgi:hypothetical protein